MVQWEVDVLRVKTSTVDGIMDKLYANSKMQRPVSVFIKAILPSDPDQTYQLTQSELDSIELIDYDSTQLLSSDGWTFTSQKGQFCHSLGNASSTANSPDVKVGSSGAVDTESAEGAPQCQVLYVSTSSIDNKNIGARIRQPNGVTVTTEPGPYDSHVTLVGLAPINYTTDNINVTKEDTANGKWDFDQTNKGVTFSGQGTWTQTNYYASTRDHALESATATGFDVDGTKNGRDDDPRLTRCCAKREHPDRNLNLFYLWPYERETTANVGWHRAYPTGPRIWTDLRSYTSVQINQKKDSFCITQMSFKLSLANWGAPWSIDGSGFTLWDMYGNTGDFRVYVSDDDAELKIQNRN